MKTKISAPKFSNCVIFAIRRFWKRGGYLIVRQSFYSPKIVHVMWSKKGKIWWGYTKVTGAPIGWWGFAIIFKGEIVMGDEKAILENERFIITRDLEIAKKIGNRNGNGNG